jgi:restriction system protein
MTIPKSNEMYFAVLNELRDGEMRKGSEIRNSLRPKFNLTQEDLAQTSATGAVLVDVRMNWAMAHLGQARALTRPDKGYLQITDLGRNWLKESDGYIDPELVSNSEGHQEWRERSKNLAVARKGLLVESAIPSIEQEHDPLTQLATAEQLINIDIASQILDRIKSLPPIFLEKLILKLLHAMGYAAGEEDLEHTGGSGDQGIDGIVHQDVLGLDKVYIQAKRYDSGKIGPSDIQSFIGALNGKKATRGVFITTSGFSENAKEVARNAHNVNVVLIDGQELVQQMLRFGIGVVTVREIQVHALDENFFNMDQD